VLYRYITGNTDFIESHTGLEDVDIERQILAYCFRKHKAMDKGAWETAKYKKERQNVECDLPPARCAGRIP
jgi:hypothetical protein